VTGSFYIRFFNKNHKHYHSALIFTCLYLGVIFSIIGYAAIGISKVFALTCFISIISGFYHFIDKKRKNYPIKKLKLIPATRR
jgi:uncharacterized membrane protein